jgi:hypothetical protein
MTTWTPYDTPDNLAALAWEDRWNALLDGAGDLTDPDQGDDQ